MNIISTVEPTSLQPPPQPPQPHRPSTSCDLHPNEHFSGFCPSCLFERLSLLDPNSSSDLPAKPHSSSSSLWPFFFRPSSSRKPPNPNNPPSSSGLFPGLRRTKSFSASKNNADTLFSGYFEPQRKSCDVRVRGALCSLFGVDEDGVVLPVIQQGNGDPEASRRSFVGVKEEEEEEEEEGEEIHLTGDYKVVKEDIRELAGEEEGIVLEECNVGGVAAEERVAEPEIVEVPEEGGKEGFLLEEELRSMKDHIDLDLQAKKSSGRDFKDIAGSFRSAASVFSKKWQKWRRKQKEKKQERGSRSVILPVMKPAGRHFRETQSEYAFGRRSCDTDPRFSLDVARFSLDVARMSLDDTRHSFEMPRASWDGHLIGRSSFQRMPTIAAVVEDSPPPARVPRTDMQIPVEMPASINDEEMTPGGSAQTRDYYLDSSTRRRKSLDRSNSIRKTAAAIVAEMDEVKSIKNAKVTPATADHYLQGTGKLTTGDKDSLRDPIPNLNHSNSLQDDCSEMFDLAFRENGPVVRNDNQKGSEAKKSKRWGKGWNIWAFIQRRAGGGHNKDIENDDSYCRPNGMVDRSYSESWQELHNGELNGFNRKVLRSNSSVSYRNSTGGGPLSGMRRNSFEANGKKRRDEFVLERNRSARRSPRDVADTGGPVGIYTTPNGSRRGSVVGVSLKGSSRANSQAHSIAKSILRLY
ncbi:hypothetical protein MLD38_039389 [Melastoma candidum]|uniref:Uncharacterized protein n=1 Tax=Melastoma candidum TaxID=119954 RepID=A0ACB9L2Z8_9MYRT|nr:hypothetical protein MLD38_039389 [Melastoma candidum]